MTESENPTACPCKKKSCPVTAIAKLVGDIVPNPDEKDR